MNFLGIAVFTVSLVLFWFAARVSRIPTNSQVIEREKNPKGPKQANAKNAARRIAKKNEVAAVALAATNASFIVADLETTGLSRSEDDIIEIAAARVRPDGQVSEVFSTLVKVGGRIPARITSLTGITTQDCREQGKPLSVAMQDFMAFVGTAPVFFHNASFDKAFLVVAGDRTGLVLKNQIFDTLTIARAVWPELPSHKLAVLAGWLGLQAPTHRALADVQATIGVLIAAKAAMAGKGRITSPNKGQQVLDFSGFELATA